MISSSAPVTIGALAARARRNIRAYFFAQHAVTAEEAVPYLPQRRIEQAQFDRMLRTGVIHEVGKGRYWFDLVAWQKQQDRRRAILVPIVIAVCVLVAGLLTLLY